MKKSRKKIKYTLNKLGGILFSSGIKKDFMQQEINHEYNFAFLDENTKREIRRAVLKAIAVPGYQVPFASRELPIFFGWGTGGLQITLSIIGKNSILKIIDQGDDDSVNAVNL